MARILVVDDDSNIRRYFAQELSGEGHEVSTVPSGKQLLSIIDVFKPDVVVLDIRLEDYNGLELLKEIRKKRYALPVILCSAYKEYKYDQRSVGADYYVVKSVDLSELKTTINRALDAHEPGHVKGS